MKAVLTVIFALFTLNTWAITNAKISELYLNGGAEEVELQELFAKKMLTPFQWEKIQPKVAKVAQEKSDIWGDTILEGDYVQLEDAILDLKSVQGILVKGKLVGFSAFVTAVSAYSGECYDDEDEAKFEACLQNFKGEISEKFIVNKKGEEIEEYFDEGAQFE